MGRARIERVTLRIGKSPGAPAAQLGGGWAAIPGRTLEVGFARLPATGTALTDPNLLSETGQIIKVPPKSHSDGPVRAIAIAPDSPIESCDLYFNGNGGRDVYRISPGCPWIGELVDGDQIRVVPVREIPYLGLRDSIANAGDAMNFAELAATTVVWDCTVVPDADVPLTIDAGGDPANVLIPLRLDMYRGDVLPPVQTRRAPYGGTMIYESTAAVPPIEPDPGSPAINPKPRMIVITDGRRRVRVMAASSDAATVQIWGLEAAIGEQEVFANGRLLSSLTDIPVYKQLLVPTATPAVAAGQEPDVLVFDYTPESGNPFFAFCVEMVPQGALVQAGWCSVRAWDE